MNRYLVYAAMMAALLTGCATPHVRIPPQAIHQVAPIYPAALQSSGVQGEVQVGFIVDTTGVPRDVFVLRSTHREFEAPAVAAVQEWRFQPGTVDGRAVNTRMTVPLVFILTDDSPTQSPQTATTPPDQTGK